MQDSLRYTLRFPHAAQHYVEVTAEVPGPNPELALAVWTPGSYLIREYSQHLEAFSARDAAGQALSWEKTRKNRWRVSSPGNATVTYRIYARTMGVQSNWVESGFALLNGAPTFLTLADHLPRTHEVTLELPADWAAHYSGLELTGPHAYSARDYDTLVDSPIYAGSPSVYRFEAAGRPHYLVNEGEAGAWNGAESAVAVEKIVREYHRMMGVIPYDQYLFFNLLLESGGGLEHHNSTVLIASRWAWSRTEDPPVELPSGQPRQPNRTNWLDLVSHEYLHLWNVKRLRPVELGPFDYEQENYTRTLWVAEGITTYYGPLAVKRAGLIDEAAYLKTLSREITQLQNTPGRLIQTVETSSYDAWIKLYRQNENSPNTLISYYTKGAVIAWLIDACVRRLTGGAKSLDDVMRLAYQRYSRERGYTSTDFRDLVNEVAGADLGSWFYSLLETTQELDYTEALTWFGLRFATPPVSGKAYLGAVTKNDAGRLVVTGIPRHTPAHAAGLNVDDELLAINGHRIRADSLAARLEHYRPGDHIELLTARRDQLRTLAVLLAPDPRRVWLLEPDPAADPEPRRVWLRD
ncbi:MAG: PDZ domain-containing protein [Bryobacteraceae bacterium]|nr:PDZ domain-containing protein [Bryobacteraceae bacterium]